MRPLGPSSWKLKGRGDSKGRGAASWMLPQPETICQLPYSVEIEDPERAYSTMDLRERKKGTETHRKPHLQLHHSHMIAKKLQNKKES